MMGNEEGMEDSGGWCGPCLPQGAGDMGMLLVKILQAVNLIVHALFCMYLRILDENL